MTQTKRKELGAAGRRLAREKSVLDMIAHGRPLPEVLEALARSIEAGADGMICSILLCDEDGKHLRHGAAPSLPASFHKAIDGIDVGPRTTPCGVAAHTGKRVITADITTDPLWTGYRDVALQCGLRACWTAPIKSSAGKVLGTFAMYYREPRSPSAADLGLILQAQDLAAIVLERDRAEAKLLRSEKQLRSVARARAMITECSRTLVRTTEENRLLHEMCRIGVETGGYRTAWIGLAQHDADKTILPVATAGDDEGYFDSVRISWADDEFGRGPAGTAIRTRVAQVARDAASDPRFKLWRKQVLDRGFRGAASFPLVYQGEAYGIFGLFSGEAETFGSEELALLGELADDIAYGIFNLRQREAMRRADEHRGLEHAVSRAIAEASSVSAAVRAAIRAICESESWECGRYFRWDETAGVLRFSEAWHVPQTELAEYVEKSRALTYEPGAGLAGKALQSGEAQWVTDISRDERVMQSGIAREAGMRSAFVFPVISDGKPMGVLAFSSREARNSEDRLVEALRAIGSQIGQFLRRKQAEEDLRRFRVALDASADLILLVDPLQKRYLDVNDAACRELGYTREEFLKMGPHDIFSISHAELAELYTRLLGGDESGNMMEGTYRRKDGSVFRVESFRRAVRSEEGDIIVAVARDITERQRRDEELRRFRAAMDVSADMIYLVDPETMRIIDANETACRKIGRTRDELLAMGPHELINVSREELSGIYGRLIAGELEESHGEAWHTRKDGHRFPVELFRRVVRSRGGPVIVAVVRDISERRAAEEKRITTESALRESNERFDTAVRATNDIIWDWNLLTDEVWWNENFAKVLGYSREETRGPIEAWRGRIHPADRDRVVNGVRGLLGQSGKDWNDEYRFRRQDGSYAYVFDRGHVIRDGNGKALRMIGAMADITARKVTEEKIRDQAYRQRLIAEFGQQVLARADLDEVLSQAMELVADTLNADYCNALELDAEGKNLVFKATKGWPTEWIDRRTITIRPGAPIELVLTRHEPLVFDDLEEPRFSSSPLREFGVRSGIQAPIFGKTQTFGVLGAYSKGARHFTEDDTSFLQSVANILSVAIERRSADERLAYLAQFDALTALPNRHLFYDRLLQAMAQARRSDRPMAVLYIDLDNFKLINDTQGHAAGDQLLKEAAARLSRCTRSGDTVGRFGGDEFAVILSDLGRPGDATIVVQKMIDTLAMPLTLEGHEVYVTASVGITLFPVDGEEPGLLIRNADTAMYRAKEQGRNSYQYFRREMNERSRVRVQTEMALRRAIERKEFFLHYQPKVSLKDGSISGFEALMRWRHPQRGTVLPTEFIPVLEDSGLIVQVGEWVMWEVCRQIEAWTKSGCVVPPVALNLSARQFQQKELEAMVRHVLASTGIDPSLIQFELTESLLMREPETAARTLALLKESGVTISVDDFGTGYSSLAYLKRFPIDALKIDRTFVRDITTNREDAAITLAIIGLAHSLKLKVVAEGVETEGQLRFLSQHACDEMQGYYFSRPVAPLDCEGMLREARRLDLPREEPR